MSAIEFDPDLLKGEQPPEINVDASNLRSIDRASTSLKAIIQIRESHTNAWKEVSRVTSASGNGLGLTLSRPYPVGRLVNLVLPMPRELRAYDREEDLYQINGIIQYCNSGLADGRNVYHIGIGLIGKDVPESFESDPQQNYRISGMTKSGFWAITEAATEFKVRKNLRYWLTIPVTLALIHREDEGMQREETFTKNVSSSGVAVSSRLNARVGDRLRFACSSLDFHAIAVVRNRGEDVGSFTTLNLEFDGHQFPMERVMPARTVTA